jgi:hypothetical protein
MASNADWVVPATADERRFFVLDVSEGRRGDRGYWDKLYRAINGAELPAFLDHLLQLDLSNFDHRNPPHTVALNEQKLIGGDSLTKFWLDCLTAGEIVGADINGLTFANVADQWPTDIVVRVLHAASVAHAHDHGDRRPLTDAHMAKKLAEWMSDRKLKSFRSRECYNDAPRPTRYRLKPLDDCRASFLKAMKIGNYAWPEADECTGA